MIDRKLPLVTVTVAVGRPEAKKVSEPLPGFRRESVL
jgi:hypothetical protein